MMDFRRLISTLAKMLSCGMIEMKKEKVEFAVLCHLVAKDFKRKWHISLVCKEDCKMLQICCALGV